LANVDPLKNLEITPNPFEQSINILSDENLDGYELKILDLQGKILYQTDIWNNQLTFGLDQPLAPGLYTFVLQGEQKNIVRNLVKN